MNLQEFMEAFNALGPEYSWEIFRVATLRARHPDIEGLICPIEAVHYARTGVRSGFAGAAREMGLNFKDRRRIMDAADHNTLNWFRAKAWLRRKMLRKRRCCARCDLRCRSSH
jgi:hypothetical protein